tara:strand:+ start:120 stop:641 length:522 start_codon:yes stop_codon:yes gene_type:complete
MNFSRIELWNYSLRFYDDPETEKALIDAQNRLGADVNLILYLLFRAQGGLRLDLDDIKNAENAVNSWRSGVIQPLREIRRNLKNYPHSLPKNDQAKIRREIKDLEIKTEQFQQQHLENLGLKGRSAAPNDAAQDNLAAYAKILSAAVSDHAFTKLLHRFITLQNAKPAPAGSH